MADVQRLHEYIAAAGSAVAEVEREAVLGAAPEAAYALLQRFCASPALRVIYLVAPPGGGAELTSRLAPDACANTVVAFVKRKAVEALAPDRLRSQLQVAVLAQPALAEHKPAAALDGFLEGLENLVQNTVAPSLEEADVPSKQLLRIVQQRAQELVVSVRTAQQSSRDAPVRILTDELVQRTAAEIGIADMDAAVARAVQELGGGPDGRLKDDQLTRLCNQVKEWNDVISQLTSVPNRHDAASTVAGKTALDEIGYWEGYVAVLRYLSTRLRDPDVQLQVMILNKNNRLLNYLAAVDVDTPLKQVEEINDFIKGTPVQELMAAADFPAVLEAVKKVFAHFTRMDSENLRKSYGYDRAADFLVLISEELRQRLVALMPKKSILDLTAENRRMIVADLTRIYNCWSDAYRSFFARARENIARARTQTSPSNTGLMRLFPHTALIQRVDALKKIRDEHDNAKQVLEGCGASAQASAEIVKKLERALGVMRECNFVEADEEAWKDARRRYLEEMDACEASMADQISERLLRASKHSEKLAIFSSYQRVLNKSRIRKATKTAQDQLLEHVKQEMSALEDEFTQFETAGDVGIPRGRRKSARVSGGFTDAADDLHFRLELSHRAQRCVQRLEIVLGAHWRSFADGNTIKMQADALTQRIDYDGQVSAFIEKMTERYNSTGIADRPLFLIEGGDTLNLSISEADMEVMRTLRFIRVRAGSIPAALKHIINEYYSYYPAHSHLQDNLYLLRKIDAELERDDKHTVIVRRSLAPLYKELAAKLTKGTKITWSQAGPSNFYADFDGIVATIDCRFHQVRQTFTRIDSLVDEFGTLPLTAETAHFEAVNAALEAAVNNVPAEDLHLFVADVNTKLLSVARVRLAEALRVWRRDLQGAGTAHISENLVVTINVKGNMVAFQPSLPAVAQHWYNHLHALLHKLLMFRRFTARKNVRVPFDELADCKGELFEEYLASYEAIENHIVNVANACEYWAEFSSLWDDNVDALAAETRDLPAWVQLMQDLQKRSSEVTLKKDQVVVDRTELRTDTVKPLIKAKIDEHIRRLSVKLKAATDEVLQLTQSLIEKVKADLNEVDKVAGVSETTMKGLDVRDGAQADQLRGGLQLVASAIEKHEEARQLIEQNNASISHLEDAQRALAKCNIDVDVEQAMGDWNRHCQMFTEYLSSLNDYRPVLIRVVDRAAERVQAAFETIRTDWETQQGALGAKDPAETRDFLRSVAEQKERAVGCGEELNKTLRLLKKPTVDATGEFGHLDTELRETKAMWDQFSEVYARLNNTVDGLSWASLQPATIKAALEEIAGAFDNLPPQLRDFGAYQTARERLAAYQDLQQTVCDLKDDAIKERHWKQILKLLGLEDGSLKTLTLGGFYERFLGASEEDRLAVRDLVERARGENSLQSFLDGIKEHWNESKLEWVEFKKVTEKPVALVTALENVYAKLDDHLNGLQSMKVSMYYNEFRDNAQYWEERLTSLRSLLTEQEEVQRKWVYLAGIFLSNSDIKSKLPEEFKRFAQINLECQNVFRKVQQQGDLHLALLQVPNLHKDLVKLIEGLGKVQKSLNDYLEKQRAEFPRFYFVGDEDLLEMIGQSREVLVVQKHLPKMFAAMATLRCSSETVVDGFASAEGDVVPLRQPIDIAGRSLIEWLAELEKQMKAALQESLIEAFGSLSLAESYLIDDANVAPVRAWADEYPPQISVLALQLAWTKSVEAAIGSKQLKQLLANLESSLVVLSKTSHAVQQLKSPIQAIRHHNMITELTHQRDVVAGLLEAGVSDVKDFAWLQQMRFYLSHDKAQIEVASGHFEYGYEYLGAVEGLVQTPLTHDFVLTMAEALHLRLGGNPFGPAGTGKTESVKFFGQTLGLFVLVFNCDEAFDFYAMNRIFTGLCEVGAWGCFDEFNRLEETILSSVSEQILIIQQGLRERKKTIELLEGGAKHADTTHRTVRLAPTVGIFVTMNPGYAGRSNLPDNLKQLFREFAMIEPDKRMISEVLLFSQGFTTAPELAEPAVQFFAKCALGLTQQSHYDFGLRALKSVLSVAGRIRGQTEVAEDAKAEQGVLVKAVTDSVLPQLVARDVAAFHKLLSKAFPEGAPPTTAAEQLMEAEIRVAAETLNYQDAPAFMEKVLQIHRTCQIRSGVMLVGATGTCKTAALDVLIQATHTLLQVPCVKHVFSPKALQKNHFFGALNNTTLEWTDGVFTATLRKILAGKNDQRRHFLVFDGDVDPQWAENFNSLLDDNALFTLPNGERFKINDRIKVIFETDSLTHATPATVSRCGMVYFNEDVLPLRDLVLNKINAIQQVRHPDQGSFADTTLAPPSQDVVASISISQSKRFLPESLREGYTNILLGLLLDTELLEFALSTAAAHKHVMPFTRIRVLDTFFAMCEYHVKCLEEADSKASVSREQIIPCVAIFLLWAFGGSMSLADRSPFAEELAVKCIEVLGSEAQPPAGKSYLQVVPDLYAGHWRLLEDLVAEESGRQAVNAFAYASVIETSDTIAHTFVINALLHAGKSFILCGPPGSGKTMTLTAALRAHTDYDIAMLNYSSGTTPEALMKTFQHYCEFAKTASGYTMRPKHAAKRLVIFADEINLPAPDAYGTQRVISLMRRIASTGFFYANLNGAWHRVKVEKVQFAGACNPPEDAGRHPMSDRWLRVAPIMFIDFPQRESLLQIYRAFLQQTFAIDHTEVVEPLTDAMVDYYIKNQAHFGLNPAQPHYIYSPRELTRWKVAIHEVVGAWRQSREPYDVSRLVRLAMHEGERIFCDKLVTAKEQDWGRTELVKCFKARFDEAVDWSRPIVFTALRARAANLYAEVERQELKTFLNAKLETFHKEETSAELVLFDDCLDHILRIDRVLRQPLGHLLLVGVAGAGKSILSRFVSWLQGLSVFEIRPGRDYGLIDFEDDLRTVMKRAGVKCQKTTFIFDESNVFEPGFLERMNALLASGEVPGLFEHESLTQLVSECRSAFAHTSGSSENYDALGYDDDNDVFAQFTRNVQRNLHIVFTMNPCNPDFYDRKSSSPALFNRCVIDWFGDWSEPSLHVVAEDFVKKAELSNEAFNGVLRTEEKHQRVADAVVSIHQSVQLLTEKKRAGNERSFFVSPREFVSLLRLLRLLLNRKHTEIAQNEEHLSSGLNKLGETEKQLEELQLALAEKEKELHAKQAEGRAKMQLIIRGKTEAGENKTQAETLETQLQQNFSEITARQEEIGKELEGIQPLLELAREEIAKIPKAMLSELQTMRVPTDIVQLVMGALYNMLEQQQLPDAPWAKCRSMLHKDFVSSVLNFDSTRITPETLSVIKQHYLQNPAWDMKSIQKASSAVGPVANWIVNLVKFADINVKVEPLRAEVEKLEAASQANQAELAKTRARVATIEKELFRLEQDYGVLFSQEQGLKVELNGVKSKIASSEALLSNLSAEKGRWQEESNACRGSLTTEAGDNLLAAAMCTYLGYFDQQARGLLLEEWKQDLAARGVNTDHNMSLDLLIDYLSDSRRRYEWISAMHLNNDQLSLQNACILTHPLRYPLVIDPSNRFVEFITALHDESKILRTYPRHPQFVKHLESALRFGNVLIVTDIEGMVPVLSNVLNRETKQLLTDTKHRDAGRALVSVGDTEVAVDPNFMLYLLSANPDLRLTPDFSSRVTLINSCITATSLQAQALDKVLQAEHPQVDLDRRNLLRTKGESREKIRELQNSLLASLNGVSGSILADDSVINTLKRLKAEAAQAAAKGAEANKNLEEVGKVTQQFEPLATVAAAAHTALDAMGNLYWFYQYDDNLFNRVYQKSLDTPAGKGDDSSRVTALINATLEAVYNTYSHSMRYQDRLVFALELACIKAKSVMGDQFDALPELQALFAPELELADADELLGGRLRSSLEANAAKWDAWFGVADPETCPIDLQSEGAAKGVGLPALRAALIVRCARPEKLRHALEGWVKSVLGHSFLANDEFNADVLEDLVRRGLVLSETISLFVSAPGFEPSSMIVQAAKKMKVESHSIAMGSSEGYRIAEQMISEAAQRGEWVILRNVHLADKKWLDAQYKRVAKAAETAGGFRLFMTTIFKDGPTYISAELLKATVKFVFEPPKGLRSAMERAWRNFVQPRATPVAMWASATLHQLYFLVVLLHSVVLERRRFVPMGWTKEFEFSDADLVCALEVVEEWTAEAAPNWAAYHELLTTAVYGGRVDNAADKAALGSLVRALLRPALLQKGEPLSLGGPTPLCAPEPSQDKTSYMHWVDFLPAEESPTWVGLAADAEDQLCRRQALATLTHWTTLRLARP